MAMTTRPRRSILYMPGSNARALEKGRSLAADGLILDLEDAVTPDAKETARIQIIDALKEGGYGHRKGPSYLWNTLGKGTGSSVRSRDKVDQVQAGPVSSCRGPQPQEPKALAAPPR